MKIIVTGAAGYVGSVVVRRLLNSDHSVVGVDNLRYGGEALLEVLDHPCFTFVRADVRDLEAVGPALTDADAVVHLAALVGDPACARDPEYARAVNTQASMALYEACDSAGVPRLVFASTCSNYGKMEGDEPVDETSELRPVSLYAETKVAFEQYLLSQSRAAACKPTILRFATAFGLSPRMRFDLTVNEFTRDLSLGRTLEIYGPRYWRPYCHVTDLAAAVRAALDADPETAGFQVFNVGDTGENYTKRMLADLIRELIPQARIDYVERTEDPRDYRVSFERIKETLGFVPRQRVRDGIAEIHRVVTDGFLSNPDDPRFTNTP